MSNQILILGDNRVGTLKQSIALAEELKMPYQIINLEYNKLAKIPNFFFSESLIRLKKSSKKQIMEITDFPEIIISAGRKSATCALYLKEKSKNQSKVIQIMNPNINLKKFDLIILPKHDKILSQNHPNIINTIGALTKIDEEVISKEQKKFATWFDCNRQYRIVLMLGGSSNKTKFSEKSAINLGKITSKIVKNMNAKLFILNSPRSGEKISEALKSTLDCDHKFFNWNELSKKGQNPYLASLAFADFFIITGDSVSMISECCATGKPVYIFDEAEISAKKHRLFHKDLFKNHYAKRLDYRAVELDNFIPRKLKEISRISKIIKERFLVD
jgi:mitochondrial fission protein ELM1